MSSENPISPLSAKHPRILITGGAGFIGSALVWELNRQGHDDILIADFLGKDEKWKNLSPLRFSDYIEADVLEQLVLGDSRTIRSEIGLIIHLGACSSTTETNAAYLIKNNFEYTKLLAEWALQNEIPFVYASSAATYGDGSNGMDDKNPDQDLVKLRPLNMYAYSKHLFDLYAWREGFLSDIIGLKYFNVFGPNEDHKGDMRSLVHKAYGQIKSTGKMQLFKSHRPEYKDGEQMRDFLYVKDAVKMTLSLAMRPKRLGGLFNLGCGQAHSWIELANAIFRSLNLEPKIDFVDMPESLRSKYQYFTQANIEKFREASPQIKLTPLTDAVEDYVVNYLETGARLEP